MKRAGWIILLAILLSGCGPAQSPEPSSSSGSKPNGPLMEVSDALRRDAETMAKQLGITVDEAIDRLLQDPIGRLGAELERQEVATFAGLWVQHEPVHRIVVAFTGNGDETIRPYVENTTLADLIEVCAAEATLAELNAAQYEAGRLVDELGLSVASGTHIQENRVELYVTDRPLFDATLQAAGVQLPDHVEVITIYEPLGDDIPFAVTPCPTIHFPQLKTRSAALMVALLEGELVVKDGCLRVGLGDGGESHLVIWQPDFFLNDNDGVIEIWDRNGEAVARVGEEVRMGGGEVRMTKELEQQLRAPMPQECEGPYLLMGELVAGD
ncbi:MAG: hypothetical protein GQ526_10310 [Ardenticatenales bacterium]|nr:hypothetical protein [Ardenticatenales bacterium]